MTSQTKKKLKDLMKTFNKHQIQKTAMAYRSFCLRRRRMYMMATALAVVITGCANLIGDGIDACIEKYKDMKNKREEEAFQKKWVRNNQV